MTKHPTSISPTHEAVDPMTDLQPLAQSNQPGTVTEAFARCLDILGEDNKKAIADMDQKTLAGLHLGLGQAIRNAWLWKSNPKQLMDRGIGHPEDADEVIIDALWERLRT